MEFKLKALTDIWTGGVKIGKCSSFRTSGVMGSLRWWYELAVRALNGYACCPVEKPCPDKDGNWCAVCELFGCTCWSKKFKLRVEYSDGTLVTEPLGENTYLFRFIFTKTPYPEEKWLLANLIKNVVAPYGSIGGKMPNKPSEHAFNKANLNLAAKQDEIHHRDFGLFEVVNISDIGDSGFTRNQIEDYLTGFQVKETDHSYRTNHPTWPMLNQLFAIKGNFQSTCFDRLKINNLLGIKPLNPSAIGVCLKGKPGKKSKDIFSFKGGRVWGYCKNEEQRINIVNKIKADLGNSITEEVVGVDFLKKLFSNGGSNV